MAAAAIDGVDPPQPPESPPSDLDQSIRAKFWRWILDDTPPTTVMSSLWSTLDHVQSFCDVRDAENTVLMRYHDLQVDLEGQMRSLADRLGIDLPARRWQGLVKAASLEEMRRRPSMTAPEARVYLDDAAFFKRARKGAWHEILDSEQDLLRYNDRVASLAPADLSVWMHPS
jgi:aryl sulfotransferase